MYIDVMFSLEEIKYNIIVKINKFIVNYIVMYFWILIIIVVIS